MKSRSILKIETTATINLEGVSRSTRHASAKSSSLTNHIAGPQRPLSQTSFGLMVVLDGQRWPTVKKYLKNTQHKNNNKKVRTCLYFEKTTVTWILRPDNLFHTFYDKCWLISSRGNKRLTVCVTPTRPIHLWILWIVNHSLERLPVIIW